MDFFTVPTLTFGVLYCFFVIGHDRRRILHFNVMRNPHVLWVLQQLREAWAYKQPHRFLLFDRDAKFGAAVVSAVRDSSRLSRRHKCVKATRVGSGLEDLRLVT
jgi:putative transposase